MGTKLDLSGQRFGLLVVIDECVERRGKNRHWNYRCDCGNRGCASTGDLRTKRKSCGCHTRDAIGERSRTHGQTVGGKWTASYRCYRAIITRCYNKNSAYYRDYGGRGIAMCGRWHFGENGRSGFECFLSDMGEPPVGRSLDRIDNDGNYEPSNCRWATRSEQARNTRATVVSIDMMRKIQAARVQGFSQNTLARMFGVPRSAIRNAIAARQ